jgi:hypothetical protein
MAYRPNLRAGRIDRLVLFNSAAKDHPDDPEFRRLLSGARWSAGIFLLAFVAAITLLGRAGAGLSLNQGARSASFYKHRTGRIVPPQLAANNWVSRLQHPGSKGDLIGDLGAIHKSPAHAWWRGGMSVLMSPTRCRSARVPLPDHADKRGYSYG